MFRQNTTFDKKNERCYSTQRFKITFSLASPLDTIGRRVRSCAHLWHRRQDTQHRNLLAVGRVSQLLKHRRHEGEGFCSGHRRSIVGRHIEATHTTGLKCQFPEK